MHIFTCNSFALTNRGGNPAGVVIDAPKLTDEEYIAIAKKVGFSETAFIFPSKHADYKIRFFTPVQEVDLCGHATIASFFTLYQQDKINIGYYKMETKAGILSIKINSDGKVFMTQPLPQYYDKINKTKIARSLNISEKKLDNHLPIQIVSTGLKDVIVPVKSRDILDQIHPNFQLITSISDQYKAVGYHLFAFDHETIYCRNFAPLLKIEEESATGTASGALAGYLYYYDKLPNPHHISFKQGFSMNRESQIDVRLTYNNKKLNQLQIGGSCKNLNTLDLV